MKSNDVLECVKETIIKVNVYDLEDFIEKKTGHTYECVPNEEWSNDSQHRFNIDGEMDSWRSEEWNAFKMNGHTTGSYLLRTILTGLCAEKHIEPAIYLITVSW